MDNSIIKFEDLTKPATILIEKISDAVGGIFKPYRIVRVAEAEAQADSIRAQSRIQVTDLQRRAMHRFLEEEGKKQANIESITGKSLPLLEAESAPEKMNDDWITNFFEKSRIISDEEMQGLWARLLAGEANMPGAFSRRTVNLVGDLDKNDAAMFTALCGFGWMVGQVVPLVFDTDDQIYNRNGINFSALAHLEALGLTKVEHLAGFRQRGLPNRTRVYYYGKPVDLMLPEAPGNDLELGHVILTVPGQQLARICSSKPVDGFFEHICQRWQKQSLLSRDHS